MKTKHATTLLFLLFSMSVVAQGTWVAKANFGGAARYGGTGFSIGTKAYLGTGGENTFTKTFWEYDASQNAWTQKADFPGPGRYQAVGFSIAGKGYIGTGGAGLTFPFTPLYNDFWQYDPGNNTWAQKANFGGVSRGAAVGFSIGNKGYIGTGFNDNTFFQKDFWEYDPSNDQWIQKADFAGTERCDATGFSIGNKGYIGTGGNYSSSIVLFKDFWEYDPANDQWAQRANFGGVGRSLAVGFSIGPNGYIGTGGNFNNASYPDFWEYSPSNNKWVKKANFGGATRWLAVGFSIGNKGFIGTGGNAAFSPDFKDLWEYTPEATAVNELDNAINISVYPNPSNGVFSIEMDKCSETDKTELLVYDMKGELVFRSIKNKLPLSIDLSTLQRGVYFLNMTANKKQVSKKILLE